MGTSEGECNAASRTPYWSRIDRIHHATVRLLYWEISTQTDCCSAQIPHRTALVVTSTANQGTATYTERPDGCATYLVSISQNLRNAV
eukprot:IDg15813t1